MERQISIASMGFALSGLLLLQAGQAHSSTDLSRFEKRLGKSAAESFDAAKALCVCKEESSHKNSVGFLRHFHEPSGPGGQIEVTVTCTVVVFFESTGEFSGQTTCDPWELLPK